MQRCSGRLATVDVALMLQAFGHYQAGFLPAAGGMQDQAAVFCEAMSMIGAVVEHHREIERER